MTRVESVSWRTERQLDNSLILKIPYMPLAELPTPVHAAPRLGRSVGHANLWIKRDDLSSSLHGGNKARKLEYLFADAKAGGYSDLLTIGAVGSNHVLSTSVHAFRCGLSVQSVQYPRPLGRDTALAMRATIARGADVRIVPSKAAVPFAVGYRYIKGLLHCNPPYWIYSGGSSVVGTIGYVVAAFELKRQVEDGYLAEPERVYVAMGSCGTAAGLLAGFRLAKMRTRVVAVRATPQSVASAYKTAALANATLRFLARRGWHHNALPLRADDLTVIHSQYGKGYGLPTKRTHDSIRLAAETEGLVLEETYTGKAMAGLIDDILSGHVGPSDSIVFWHTYGDVGQLVPPDP
jgi:D-cysteine desulfhydrase